MQRFWVAALCALAMGCGDDGHDEPGGDELVGEACEHAVSGPYFDVTAAADASSAPAAKKAHHLVRITLMDVEGGKGGTVTYAADESGDFVIFATKSVPLSVKAADGTVVAIEATSAVTACDAVAEQHTVELGIGTYDVVLGPTTESEVGLVIEHAVEAH